MGLDSVLSKYSSVSLDTAVFIYHFEKNRRYFPLVQPIFSRLDTDFNFQGITSIVTLLELLVRPIQENRDDLVNLYSRKLLSNSNFKTFPVNESIAIMAARVRANYRIKTPDAIQIATAIENRAEIFITNDNDLKKVDDIEVLVLSDFLK